jgi:hypothetical protein
MKPYLRRVDGTIICRADSQPVRPDTIAAHRAQWHSLSPKPAPEGHGSGGVSTVLSAPSAPRRWARRHQSEIQL